MQSAIRKITNLINHKTPENESTISERDKGYIAGLQDAIKAINESITDNMIVGHIYYVIMYEDGDIYRQYVQPMKLYKISTGRVKRSYCFTNNIDSFYAGNPDLVLASERGIRERVFFTEEQALEHIK